MKDDLEEWNRWEKANEKLSRKMKSMGKGKWMMSGKNESAKKRRTKDNLQKWKWWEKVNEK